MGFHVPVAGFVVGRRVQVAGTPVAQTGRWCMNSPHRLQFASEARSHHPSVHHDPNWPWLVRDDSGCEGVYRQPKGRVNPKARERFRREVGILSGGAVEHRSVVRLLDWDADAERSWYISERGDPFIEWWRS